MIRKATSQDIFSIKSIDHIVPLDAERSKFIERAVKQNQAYILENDRNLIGYGVIRDNFFGYPFIEMLYIREEEREKGYGRRLLCDLKDNAKGEKVFT